jgi:hypothetical protein
LDCFVTDCLKSTKKFLSIQISEKISFDENTQQPFNNFNQTPTNHALLPTGIRIADRIQILF